MNDRNRRYDELCAKYTKRLIAALVGFGRTPQDAADIAQEVLVEMWKHIDNVKPGAEWPYLKTAAFRRGRNQVRHGNALRRGGGNNVSLEAVGGAIRDESASTEKRLIDNEESRRFSRDFHTAMSELPQETQLCVVLRSRGYGPNEIAKHLGTTSDVVRSRLKRAFKYLREHVAAPPHDVKWTEFSVENDDDHEE